MTALEQAALLPTHPLPSALPPQHLADGLERLDAVAHHLGDGKQRRAQQQAGEEQQHDEQHRRVHAREPALQPNPDTSSP